MLLREGVAPFLAPKKGRKNKSINNGKEILSERWKGKKRSKTFSQKILISLQNCSIIRLLMRS